ncbi:glycosyltransferase domain-containing protein [Parasulfitobacter algicola]|uniref:DUF616 domain-containing protein n=1 Tax=Parasulfitobacter algicola TaxID=2614809 RepID=A0ABX2IV09_9RHOB|nr:glycosyltransferase domain-containing protein [Sulfitobacter algicola]NSX54028.1 DUF616 domain-containing protein [Sulfitobacter algicola]
MSDDALRIVLFSCYYGKPEPFNTTVFGDALGHYPCVVVSDDADLKLPSGMTLLFDDSSTLDVNRASRRAKLMPDAYFPDVDWSIYIDNNARIIVDPLQLITALEDAGAPTISFTRHPDRTCVYAEANACIDAYKDTEETIRNQMRVYRAQGYPEEAGLIYGGFIVRNHRAPDLVKLGRLWFEHLLVFSRRDQLSFGFTARRCNIVPFFLEDIGLNKAALFEWPIFRRKQRRDWSTAKQKKKKKKFLQRIKKIFSKLSKGSSSS